MSVYNAFHFMSSELVTCALSVINAGHCLGGFLANFCFNLVCLKWGNCASEHEPS